MTASEEALDARLRTLLGALDPTAAATRTDALVAAVAGRLEGAAETWLALAVLTGELPDEQAVLTADRIRRLEGPEVALAPMLRLRGRDLPRVRVAQDAVLVDVHHTAQTDLATGIQRVARQATRRWVETHAPELVGWSLGFRALRPLTAPESRRALHGGAPAAPAAEQEVVVPWRARYVLPELLTEWDRSARLAALLRFSGTRGSFIGFDCCPVTVAETVAAGMPSGFAWMLGAAAWADRLTTISAAAAAEYGGWRRMLPAAGLTGPEIRAIPLASESPAAGQVTAAQARVALGVGDEPVVLVVGSHEPRKNHLAVLHAAEVLWREGSGSPSRSSGATPGAARSSRPRSPTRRQRGRPVTTVRGLGDDMLAAAYATGAVHGFPSWNEGFGLPVVESLAAGTPVITSAYGAMAEVATPAARCWWTRVG